MRQIEDIFYTNLSTNESQLALIINQIKQKEEIVDQQIFIITHNDEYNRRGEIIYHKYWKSHDCAVLELDDFQILKWKTYGYKIWKRF